MKTSLEKGTEVFGFNSNIYKLPNTEIGIKAYVLEKAFKTALQDFADKIEKLFFIDDITDDFIGMKEEWDKLRKQEGI